MDARGCINSVSAEDTLALPQKPQPEQVLEESLKNASPKKPSKVKRKLNFCDGYVKRKKKRRPQQKQEKSETSEDKIPSSTSKEPSDNLAVLEKGLKTPEKCGADQKKEEEPLVTFTIGDLVWSKLKGFDWWPGRVVSYLETRLSPPNPGHHWIRWFGDDKFSQMLHMCVRPFHEFEVKFNPSKMRGVYKKAIYEALEMAAKRSKRSFTRADIKPKEPKKKQSKKKSQKPKPSKPLPTEKSKDGPLSEEEFREAIMSWALDGFLPDGPAGFAPSEDEMNFKLPSLPLDNSKDDTDKNRDSNSTSSPDISKGRFGKPINEPNLASDVKALFDEVADGKRKIEDICLGCGDLKVCAKHPLFEGGVCKECKQTFLECSYLYDDDGYQMYCTICGDGQEVFMCDNEGCYRSYCGLCVDMLAGQGTVNAIISQPKWICYMCTGKPKRLIKRRHDWENMLYEFFQSDKEEDYKPPPQFPIIPPEERRPIRVLSLFDGIASGFHALTELGIAIEVYYSVEIDEQAVMVNRAKHGEDIIHLGDVFNITEDKIEELGPFDLVLGGSPCQDLSIANPARRGIYGGTARLFFEFFRLWFYARFLRTGSSAPRPFFWLFENVVGMRAEDKKTISRFFKTNPVVVDAKDVSPAHRARYFWGNLPGMNRPTKPVAGDKLSLQECLEPNCGRKARFTKVQTITTNANSLRQTKNNLLPVSYTDSEGVEREDILWCTEMERLFGFPSHYTDVNNMGRQQRQRLLGNAWSIPVIRHLLSPLKDYFKCRVETNKMTS